MSVTTVAVDRRARTRRRKPQRADTRGRHASRRVAAGRQSLLIGLLMLLPIIWMVFTAFKPETDIVPYPPTLWPREFTLDHYVDVWKRIPFARLYVNTIIFAGGVTLISLFFDSMAAYALARIAFPGRDFVFVGILLPLMLPFQVTLIPLYDMLNGMG